MQQLPKKDLAKLMLKLEHYNDFHRVNIIAEFLMKYETKDLASVVNVLKTYDVLNSNVNFDDVFVACINYDVKATWLEELAHCLDDDEVYAYFFYVIKSKAMLMRNLKYYNCLDLATVRVQELAKKLEFNRRLRFDPKSPMGIETWLLNNLDATAYTRQLMIKVLAKYKTRNPKVLYKYAKRYYESLKQQEGVNLVRHLSIYVPVDGVKTWDAYFAKLDIEFNKELQKYFLKNYNYVVDKD